MTVPAAAVHLSRKYLKDAGYQVGGTTGAIDTRDRQALSAEIERRRDELDPDYRDKILTGSSNRQLVAHIQLLARDKGAEPGKIDGLWGTRTDFAFSQLQHFDQYGQLPAPWRDPTAVVSPASQWPIQERAKLIAFYGQPGSHLTTIDIPYVLRIDWEPAVSTQRITCHDKVAASVQRVLHRVVSHYGEERIREPRRHRAVDARLGHRTRFRSESQQARMGPRPCGVLPPRIRRVVARMGGGGVDQPGPAPQLRLDACPSGDATLIVSGWSSDARIEHDERSTRRSN